MQPIAVPSVQNVSVIPPKPRPTAMNIRGLPNMHVYTYIQVRALTHVYNQPILVRPITVYKVLHKYVLFQVTKSEIVSASYHGQPPLGFEAMHSSLPISFIEMKVYCGQPSL